MVSLAIDNWDGAPPQVQTYRTNALISYPILMLGTANGIREDYACTYHIYFVIGGDGVITYRGFWNDAAIRTAVDDALAALGVSSTELPAAAHRLGPAYPNPFNPRTSIPFELAGAGDEVAVRLEILDVRGRLMRTLLSGRRTAGRSYVVDWDGSDDGGRRLPSGVYLARLTADGVASSRPVTLIK